MAQVTSIITEHGEELTQQQDRLVKDLTKLNEGLLGERKMLQSTSLDMDKSNSELSRTSETQAAAVTEMPNGSRQCSLIISPGCGGLCINMFFLNDSPRS